MTASPAAGNPPDTSSPHQFDAAEEGAKHSPAATALTNARPTWWQLSSLRRKRAEVLPHKHSDQRINNGHGPGALTRAATDGETSDTHRRQNKISRTLLARAVTFGVVPVLLMALTLAAGCLKYLGATDTNAAHASIESVAVAKDGTVAMLSYTPATAEKSLTAAGERMTGPFRDSYASLIHDVVIPGAKEKNVSAVATVPAAAAVSASVDHAVVLVYVNQAITVGNSAPTQTSSVVQVTLDRSGEQWRISGFDPK